MIFYIEHCTFYINTVHLRGAMEAHQTSNLGVLSSSLSEDVFIIRVNYQE